MKHTTFVYRLDSDDVIREIEGPWDEFAVQNNGSFLDADHTIGRSLFDFVSGSETIQVFRAIHDTLRHSDNKQTAFKYRCDSPELKRNMSMTINMSGNMVEYKSTILSEIEFESPVPVDYASKIGLPINMCSWCKKFENPAGSDTWHDIEHFFHKVEPPYHVIHGICDSCRLNLEDETENFRWH